MSRGVTLSVLGLYNADSGLFSEMQFPAGFTDEEKQTTVGNILTECAELEILITDPEALKEMIGLWSGMYVSVWTRIFTASKQQYNPIENYNRTELETVETHGADTHSGSDSTTSSANNTETNSGTDTATNSMVAYDSNSLLTHDQNTLLHGHVVADYGSGSSSVTHGHKINKDDLVTRNNHTSGNIGVTTSQQMLEQEIEVSAKLNVIKMIVEAFKDRFCLLVY